MLENVNTINELINFINSLDESSSLTINTSPFRTKSRELSKDDKEHGKVLNVLLEKLDRVYSKRLLGTKEYLLKHIAWTWF